MIGKVLYIVVFMAIGYVIGIKFPQIGSQVGL